MRKQFFLVILLLCISASLWGEKNISFKWAVFRGEEALSLTPVIHVKPGDKFKFFIQPLENSFIYLFAYRAGEPLKLLFPASSEDFIRKEYWLESRTIPPLKMWYELPETGGKDEFFLIVSPEPKKSWTNIIKKITANEKQTPDDREMEALYKELRSMLRDYIVPEVILEEAVPIAGSVKSPDDPEVKMISCSSLFIDWFKLVY